MSACRTVIKKVKDVAQATALVMDWFERENKPVTPQSLTDALGSRVAKPLVQKILEQQHTDGKLHIKELKKVRFYYLNLQAGPADAAIVDDDAAAGGGTTMLNGAEQAAEPSATEKEGEGGEDGAGQEGAAADHAAALHDVGVAGAALAERYRRLARWRQWPSRAERAARRVALETEVRQLQAGIDALQLRRRSAEEGGAQLVDEGREACVARVCRVVRRYRRARQQWLERKCMAMRLLEASGGEMHSPQQVATLLGCTTDADAGVSFEATAVALPPSLLREYGLG